MKLSCILSSTRGMFSKGVCYRISRLFFLHMCMSMHFISCLVQTYLIFTYLNLYHRPTHMGLIVITTRGKDIHACVYVLVITTRGKDIHLRGCTPTNWGERRKKECKEHRTQEEKDRKTLQMRKEGGREGLHRVLQRVTQPTLCCMMCKMSIINRTS